MKIAIDIDGVIADFYTEFIKYYNKIFGKNLKINDLTTLYFHTILGVEAHEAVNFVRQFNLSNESNNLPIIENSLEILKNLKQNHELHVITSREIEIENKTKNWINENFPQIFKNIYFSFNPYHEKSKILPSKLNICKTLNIDYMIEDSTEQANECASQGIRVLLFDQPWNQAENLHENITRVFSWKEIVEKLG